MRNIKQVQAKGTFDKTIPLLHGAARLNNIYAIF